MIVGDTNGNNLLDISETWNLRFIFGPVVAGQQTHVDAVIASDSIGSVVVSTDETNYFGVATLNADLMATRSSTAATIFCGERIAVF